MAVITVSHGTLSATQELASYLAEELHYRVIDREEVWEAAKVYGIEDTGLGKVGIIDQRPPSFWNRFTDTRRQYLVCFRLKDLDLRFRFAFGPNDCARHEKHQYHKKNDLFRTVI